MDLAGKGEGDQDATLGVLAVRSIRGETAWNQKESITGERWAEEGRKVNENPEMSSMSDHMHMEKHADNQEKTEQEGSPYEAPLCPFHTEYFLAKMVISTIAVHSRKTGSQCPFLSTPYF